jgi:hypothetical protein
MMNPRGIRQMKKLWIFLFSSFIVMALAWAGDIKFDYTWKSPDAQPVIFAGKKVAVVLVSTDRAGRRAVEDSMAKEITKRGAEGVASSEIISETDLKNPDVAKAKFAEAGIAGVMVIRATPKGGEPVDPNMWKDPMYKDVWGFTSRSWNQESGETKKDVKFRVEIAIYSVEQQNLVWIGTTQMKSSKLVEFIQGVIDQIAEEMQKENLLANRPNTN